MPAHAVAGHVVLIVAPVTALLAFAYALAPRARAALRWPLVLVGAATAGLVIWVGEAGGRLRGELARAAEATGETLPAAVQQHAKGSDALAVAVVALGIVVLSVVWGALRPDRRTGTGARVAAGALVLASAAVLVTTATVLVEATRAVWSTHGLWPA